MKSSERWLAAICLALVVICAVIAIFYGRAATENRCWRAWMEQGDVPDDGACR